VTTGLAGGPAGTAQAASSPLDSQTVVSGNARFEVLSPTLIRTEYAQDGDLTDASTFNVIGRESFGATPFTRTVTDGWLTIDTGRATLRYKEGSGAFTSRNLEVRLTTGTGQQVTGSPWGSSDLPTCTVGRLCEAETLSLQGLAQATDHTGYTGTGFAAGYEHDGDSLTFATDVDVAGDRTLALRYANHRAGDGQVTTRTLSVVVDDGDPTTVALPAGSSWDDWRTLSTTLSLSAGTHRVTVERSAGDSGNVNLDSLGVLPVGAAYPDPTTSAADCALGTLCEAETTSLVGGATIAADHNGFSGRGFTAGLTQQGAALVVHVTGAPAAGRYDLQVRYANGQADARRLSVRPGADGAETVVPLEPTSGWDYWRTVAIPVRLPAGDSDLTVGCADTASCGVNLDTLAVTTTDSPLLAPHAALGGYRRDLDTVDGSAKTNPGLLYQDGWSLLDDTTSSLYDPGTETITARGDHHGEAYLDGYVFAYGSDYTGALEDLSRLTGPTKLLPRWAYGVWFSEYYDHYQDAYENQIIPGFAANGVPVDSMAIDTNYKQPDQWNGWEVDTTKFPDLPGLLSLMRSKGIHNTFNVHPSISDGDPRFAGAQAAAGGRLTWTGETTGGGKKYVFDWADPVQLKTYFDLHDDIGSNGVELWWLDYCCSDASVYSAPGVTPDAFINQKYADYGDAALQGRGFAYSRAYGALTAGGYGNPQAVPTGPWADKRTTLHFTGDTKSTWEMLKAEVGYTPGESASTGLAAVSHDIGGHTGGLNTPNGAEPGSQQLPADLYARWVQLGTFQPIDRLHSDHSDRLPWQYPAAANSSATTFLNLRERLVPFTYTLAAAARRTGGPIVQPLYLQYPESPEAYALAGSEYLYGPDVLVAPVTTPGETATTTVWFPEGSSWTDYFTGTTYLGGTTAQVTTGLEEMPVFVRSGGIVPTRSHDVANDTAPLDAVTLTVAGGADGAFTLYEDDGATASTASASTPITYTDLPDGGRLDIGASSGAFTGQVSQRTWTAAFTDAERPTRVTVDGSAVDPSAWTYDASTRTVTVTLAGRPVTAKTSIAYTTTDANTPEPPAPVSVSAPTVSARSQVFGTASGRISLRSTVSGATAGTVSFRSGARTLGSAPIVRQGATSVATLTIPADQAVGTYGGLTATLRTDDGRAAVSAMSTSTFSVLKAKIKKLKVRAPKKAKKGHKVKVHVKVSKMLTNGRAAKGKVWVDVGRKAYAHRSVAAMRKKGVVTLPKKAAKGKKFRIRVRFVPAKSLAAGVGTTTVRTTIKIKRHR